MWSKTDGEKENTMEMLGLKETAAQIAKANGMRWYRHVLRRDDGHVLREALEFEVRGKRKPGSPKKTWKMQVEKESKSVGRYESSELENGSWRDCCLGKPSHPHLRG